MNIRPKTVRRLLILFLALVLVVAGIGTFVAVSLHRQRAELADLRVKALTAYKAQDYRQSVQLLSNYLTRSHTQNTDPEAVFAYGKSRAEVPMEGGRHVYEAIGLLEHYLQLEPADSHDARHLLLKLYTQAHYSKEARTLADGLLATNPNDADALRAKIQALVNDHNYADALATCQKLNTIAPLDLWWQRNELQLMSDLKQPADRIVAHARQLLEKHPDDPRFQTVMAVAYAYAKDDANAARFLEAAAKGPPTDADSDIQIIALLDANYRFDLSDKLLARAISKDDDRRLQKLLIRRLFERQEMAQVADKLKDLDPRSAKSDAALLGYRAMALYELHRPAEATPIVSALAARKEDVSDAWAEALRARYATPPLEPVALIKAYGQAITRDPENPVFHFFLGDARAGLEESDEARREWSEAARLSPSWALPVYRISRSLSAAGRYPEAARTAELVRRIAPGMLRGEVAYAVAWWGLIAKSPQAINSAYGENLLKLVEWIQSKSPDQTDTLPIYVSLLSRRGQRDKAIEVVKSALAAEPPPSEVTLAQLTAASDQEHLGLDQLILDRAEKIHGVTPAVGFARAMSLYNSGKRQEALQLVQTFRQSHPNDPSWQLGEARFRDLIGDPDAVKAWIDVCDAHPDDLRVQYDALSSPSRQTDREFWHRTIKRVEALTGADAQAWRIEEARWQLSGQPTAQDLDTVIASLQRIVQTSPELADVHQLLAQALLRTGKLENTAKAITELTAAHDLQPDDFRTASELATLLASQGMHDKAVAMVDAVSHAPALPMNHRLWAAGMYANLGYTDAAIKLLTADGAAKAPDADRDALLASLYRRAGRLDDAAMLYKTILADPAATPNALVAGANFFATSGQPDLTDRFVDRLQKMSMKPGTIEVVRAQLDEVRGLPQEALQTLTAAAKAHPEVEQVWQELSGFYLRQGNLDDADKTAAAGLQAIPSAAGLSAMRLQIGRMRSLNLRELGSLLEVVSHNPRQPVADQTLAALADAKARNEPPAQTLSTLRQLADQHADFLPLQELVVRRYIALSRFKDAGDVASRAGEIAPNDPEPLRLLCAVHAAAGNWQAAREAASRWRQMTLAQPCEADLMIASTYLEQPNPDPDAALKQLAPYMANGAAEAQKNAALPVYCRALIAAGRPDDAAALLQPLLGKSQTWRLVWLELAVAGQKDADAASQWIRRALPAIPADSPPDQLALAQAWEQVGDRYDSVKAHEAARDVLRPIMARSPVPLAAWPEWAMVSQSLGDLPGAERAWQEYLKADPGKPDARNNLAYVMLLEGGAGQLAKAEQLAASAIAADPNVSTFYDTLARIELRSGKTDEAVKNFRTALDKNPNNVEAMIGLADVLQSRPDNRDEARSLLTRINTAVQGGTPLAAPLRKELDRVKNALSASL